MANKTLTLLTKTFNLKQLGNGDGAVTSYQMPATTKIAQNKTAQISHSARSTNKGRYRTVVIRVKVPSYGPEHNGVVPVQDWQYADLSIKIPQTTTLDSTTLNIRELLIAYLSDAQTVSALSTNGSI